MHHLSRTCANDGVNACPMEDLPGVPEHVTDLCSRDDSLGTVESRDHGLCKSAPRRPCSTLGELLGALSGLLPDQVRLCRELLVTLRNLEPVAAVQFDEGVSAEIAACAKNLGEIASAPFGTFPNYLDVSPVAGSSPYPVHLVDDKPFERDSVCGRQVSVSHDHRDANYVSANPMRAAHSLVEVCSFDRNVSLSSSSKGASSLFGHSFSLDNISLPLCLPPRSYSWRRRIFALFDEPSSSVCSWGISLLLMITIAVSMVSFIMESMPEFRYRAEECKVHRTVENCEPKPLPVFYYIEAVCIGIFTVDYLARVLTAHSVSSLMGGCVYSTLDYLRQPLNIVDLIAVLPFYVSVFVGSVGIARVLRLFRVLRLLKLAKRHRGAAELAQVLAISGMPFLTLVFLNVIITIFFASLIFYAEGQAFSVAPKFTQPSVDLDNETLPAPFPLGVFVRRNAATQLEEPTPFRSIPYAIWWVLVTMTTVGYGDYYPTTTLGKFIGVACFYVGIIFLALPISVLGTNYERLYRHSHPRGSDGKSSRARKTNSAVGSLLWTPGSSIREAIFLLFDGSLQTCLGRIVTSIISATILISTVSCILETMPSTSVVSDACTTENLTVETCLPTPHHIFSKTEAVSVVIFTVEYLLRVSTAHTKVPDAERTLSSGLRATLVYAFQVLNIVDVLAIVPFYIKLTGGGGGGSSLMRVLRLVRVFRVLKWPKMRACADMFMDVVYEALPALFLLLFMTGLTGVLFASLIVFAEGTTYSVDHFREKHPEGLYIRPTKDGYDIEPSPFQSILYAFWWFFATATTVGYGDDYPTTSAGRTVAVFTFYTGIVLLALPITIVGSCFEKQYFAFVKEFETLSTDESATLIDEVDIASCGSFGAGSTPTIVKVDKLSSWSST
eukprot:TRINITY_DN26159_c0_g1_i2.p1 TRINITY_DN26159_c0_g1~~TRINITY_DN26159_c0_g1_i2.p1  ORF type:complete len:896 (+),score=97.92 TRINITY_DN26159_c0_g1_i2:50-2737(+)